MRGFEPPTTATPLRCATRLRYTPKGGNDTGTDRERERHGEISPCRRNLGASYIRERSENMNAAEAQKVYDDIKANVMDLLKQNLRPEFLNRIDDIIVFHPLDKNAIKDIVRLQFEHIKKMLQDKGIPIELDNSAQDLIVKRGYDPVFGARPLKRLMQKEIVNELAKELISGKLTSGKKIVVTSVNNEIKFVNK